MKRRDFMKGAAAMSLISSFGPPSGAQNNNSNNNKDIPQRPLGRTGVQVSVLGLGGSHIGGPDLTDDASVRLIRAAIDRGITFMDNSWDYHSGQSEIRMGKALQESYREKVFLMTKIDGRTKEEAARQLDESLRRLQVDHVDLIQHHEIIRFDDPDRIFDQGGAQEALLEARKAGKARFIGFTGHKDPHVHLYMLQVAAEHGFRFDTVQMPLNVMDAHYRSFEKLVLPKLVEQGIGVLGMKSMGSGVILKSKIVQPADCLHYALNLPTSVVITGIDKQEILDQAVQAAVTFRPMTPEQVAGLVAKTREVAAHGEYELFKTSQHFDSTAKHPEWLGEESPRVQQLAPAS